MKSTPAPFPTAWHGTPQELPPGAPTIGWSLMQPWATLVAHGYKKLETRGKGTRCRGRVAIHASLSKPAWARQACADSPFIQHALQLLGYTFDSLPRGGVLAMATITDCRRMVAGPTQAAGELDIEALREQDPEEYAFGFYDAGRWAYTLAEVTSTPLLRCAGALGFWKLPQDVVSGLYAGIFDKYGPPAAPALVIGCDFATGPDVSHTVVMKRHPDGSYETLDPARAAPLLAEAERWQEPLVLVAGKATGHPFYLPASLAPQPSPPCQPPLPPSESSTSTPASAAS